jgi:hypothetical protein
MSDIQRPAQRVRVEQGIYQQPNGKYAVCFMVEGNRAFEPSATTSTPPASSAPPTSTQPDGGSPRGTAAALCPGRGLVGRAL